MKIQWIRTHKAVSLLLAVGILLAAALAGFVIWAEAANPIMPEATAALQSDDAVTVESGADLVFTPVLTAAASAPTVGVIIYPGGRVDARAYAPYARGLAQGGYLVVITPMPLNLAVLAPSRALEVMDAHPEITTWAIGGHSLGGAMAANFAANYPQKIAGVFFWASYPAGGDDLSQQNIKVVSVYGTRDGLATPEKVLASKPLLPPDTLFVPVPGGNHAQFGWYGDQAGDNPAQVTHAAQMELTLAATLTMLQAIK